MTPDEIRSWLAQIEQRSQHVETADHRRLLDELDEIAELLVGKHDQASEGLKVQARQLIDRIDPSRASTWAARARRDSARRQRAVFDQAISILMSRSGWTRAKPIPGSSASVRER